MNKQHFNPTIIILSRSIGHAASSDELYVISQQIEQASEDFKFFHIPKMAEDLADLREQLQARQEELKRNDGKIFNTRCGTLYL